MQLCLLALMGHIKIIPQPHKMHWKESPSREILYIGVFNKAPLCHHGLFATAWLLVACVMAYMKMPPHVWATNVFRLRQLASLETITHK